MRCGHVSVTLTTLSTNFWCYDQRPVIREDRISMKMDCYEVNTNLLKLYRASKEARHLCNEQRRLLKAERNWSTRNPKSLVDFALHAIAANFIDLVEYIHPVLESEKYLHKLLAILPTKLPLDVSSKLLPDGIYWKRSCHDTWSVAHFCGQFKGSWKNLYMEKYLQDYIENAHPSNINLFALKELVNLVRDYVNTLNIEQLQIVDIPSNPDFQIKHIDLRPILSSLNNLTDLSIKMGVKNCGLKFSRNAFELTNADSINIGRGLEQTMNLKKFKITRCTLDETKLRSILDSLVLLPSLQRIDFSSCNISDAGMSTMSPLLPTMTSLHELILTNNKIGPDGASILASVFIKCSSLRHLDLRLNFIEDVGAEKLLAAVADHGLLEQLVLSACKLTANSVDSLRHLIGINTRLVEIDLNCNRLGEAAGLALIEALRTNSTLQKLDLKMNNITSEDVTTIEVKLATNKRVFVDS